jgi:hypothetical protein
MPPSKVVHGDDLLYRFFQDALSSHPALFAAVPQLLITTMAIWLPLDVYEQWPVLLPWVVRDPKCRGNKSKGIADEWSFPDDRGYLRDDNSLVKSLPRSLNLHGPKGSHIDGAQMGTEFVAAHVWRVVDHELLASRLPLLNSFVPNIVWLPGQVAKLTDLEGGIVQTTLQAMAFAVYRNAPVKPHLRDVADEAWALIPAPSTSIEPIDRTRLNWFTPTPAFYKTRSTRLAAVVTALEQIERGEDTAERVVTTAYATGLPGVDPAARSELLRHLRRFATHNA